MERTISSLNIIVKISLRIVIMIAKLTNIEIADSLLGPVMRLLLIDNP